MLLLGQGWRGVLGQRRRQLEVDELGMCRILASPLLAKDLGAPPEAMALALVGYEDGCVCAEELDLGFMRHFSGATDGLVALEVTEKRVE